MRFSRDVVTLLKKTIEKEGWIDLPSPGQSMYPLIQTGDICRYSPVSLNQLKKGEILLIWEPSGTMVAHRYYYTTYIDAQPHVVCKGDTNIQFDAAISIDRVIGKLKTIKRKKRRIHVEDLSIFLWGVAIQTIPLLSSILHKYAKQRSISI